MTLLLKEKMVNYEKYEDDENVKSDLSKFMGLVLSQNKKDVAYHHAIWSLQDFEFMEFSDKFPKLNLYNILNHNGDPEKENHDLNKNENDE